MSANTSDCFVFKNTDLKKINTDVPSKLEIVTAIKSLKNNKVPARE